MPGACAQIPLVVDTRFAFSAGLLWTLWKRWRRKTVDESSNLGEHMYFCFFESPWTQRCCWTRALWVIRERRQAPPILECWLQLIHLDQFCCSHSSRVLRGRPSSLRSTRMFEPRVWRRPDQFKRVVESRGVWENDSSRYWSTHQRPFGLKVTDLVLYWLPAITAQTSRSEQKRDPAIGWFVFSRDAGENRRWIRRPFSQDQSGRITVAAADMFLHFRFRYHRRQHIVHVEIYLLEIVIR